MDDFFAVAWKDGSVVLLDQLKLPDRVVYRRFRTAESVALAIKKMVVRGAPAIGVAAGFGMCLEANRIRTDNPEIFIAGI
jgi:methylthioribose-1-phosphate isomerase